MNFARRLATAACLTASFALAGCDKQPAPASKEAAAHSADDGHDHAHDAHGEHKAPASGHDGPMTALGSSSAGAFQLVAKRDERPLVAGKDVPIDVLVTPAAGSSAKASAVRFWIGSADAKGSVKAKAEVENPAEPNRWHTHVEIPEPLAADAKLWVEIEVEGGPKSVTSFDLKR